MCIRDSHLSNYLHWDQLGHAENWLLFEKNIGAYVCIDEVALSRGELYTVLINKETHGDVYKRQIYRYPAFGHEIPVGASCK